jgi:hypothetical protein
MLKCNCSITVVRLSCHSPILEGEQPVCRRLEVATKRGRPTVEGVEPGDTLLRSDGFAISHATMGRIVDALHGEPGETRVLVLQRGSEVHTARATVISF